MGISHPIISNIPEEYFVKFLKENADNIKAEYFIPLLVNDLIQTGKASVTVLDTPSKWFGVTYAPTGSRLSTKFMR